MLLRLETRLPSPRFAVVPMSSTGGVDEAERGLLEAYLAGDSGFKDDPSIVGCTGSASFVPLGDSRVVCMAAMDAALVVLVPTAWATNYVVLLDELTLNVDIGSQVLNNVELSRARRR